MTTPAAPAVRPRTYRNAAPGRSRLWLVLVALAPGILLALLTLQSAPPLAAFRDLIFDQYMRAHPRPYDPALPVRVIDIDDESLKRHGQWPWPRPLLADLTQRLQAGGAAAIAFDILMAEPDRFSPEQLAAHLPPSQQRSVLETLAATAEQTHDAIFGRALEGESAVIALVGTQSRSRQTSVPIKHGFAFAGDRPHDFLPQLQGAVLPLDAFIAPAAGLASLNFFPDRDLVVRRAPTLMMIGDTSVPGLALEALRIAQRASTFVVKSSNASGETAFGAKTGIVSMKTGDIEIATERDGAVRIYYAGTQKARRIPAWTILAGASPNEALQGAILFVGSSAAGMDIRATPLDGAVPGVDVHAELAEHVLSGAQLRRPDYANGLEALAILFFALVAALLALFLRAGAGAATAAFLVLATGAASWFAFTRLGLLFDPVMPALALLSGFGAATVVAYRSTEKDRSRIREAFGRYVSPEFVERLAADPAQLKLGGENRDVTVMFTDIRNFTARAEQMRAEQVVQFLNAVHTPMTNAVLRHKGTIDKYIGDGLMAFWNAPLDDADHVRHALSAALDMVAALPSIVSPVTGQPLEDMRLGIAIHTGQVCVGNLGSDARFDYSIVGDTVNSAARLEPLSKQYGVAIIVSDDVVRQAPDFAYLKIDDVILRGKQTATGIHALVGDEALAKSETFRQFSALHEKMRAARAEAADWPPLLEQLMADPLSHALTDYFVGLRDGSPGIAAKI